MELHPGFCLAGIIERPVKPDSLQPDQFVSLRRKPAQVFVRVNVQRSSTKWRNSSMYMRG